VTEEEPQKPQAAEEENAERLEEIRQSVTDESVKERVERLQSANGEADSEANADPGRRRNDAPSVPEFSKIKEVVTGWSGSGATCAGVTRARSFP
jgi:hypothetical protein